MLAESQSFGKVPELSDWVNITCSTGAICSAHNIIWACCFIRFKIHQKGFNIANIKINVILDMAGYGLEEKCCYLLW